MGLVLLTALSVLNTAALAQASLAQLRTRAIAALGADAQQLEFTADGWEACLGQPWNISDGWARWSLNDYRRVMDYNAGASLQTATRQAAMDPDRIGGCGAQPGAAPAPQQSSISATSPWSSQLLMWMTPHGLLKLATDNAASVTDTADGYEVTFTFTQNAVSYPVSALYSKDGQLQVTQTRIDNSVFGDMLVETRFGPYNDFAGVRFPSSIEQLQGGYTVLSLTIINVDPASTASAQLPPRQGGAGGGGGAQPVVEPSVTALTDDILVSNGAYQAVIVNQPEGLVIIDGLQSDERSAEIIAQAKAAFPGKDINYVISTHNHFDHASGLRDFVAEGATIITHMINAEFFETALSVPRTLEHQDAQNRPVKVLGIGDYFSIGSGDQQIEIYKLEGSLHADDMLIAYLPGISTIVEADLLQPWINPVFGGGRDGPHPFLVYLADELERLELPYTQFIPIHRPPQPPTMQRSELLQATGR